mgnify:CR=1 FL=1
MVSPGKPPGKLPMSFPLSPSMMASYCSVANADPALVVVRVGSIEFEHPYVSYLAVNGGE